MTRVWVVAVLMGLALAGSPVAPAEPLEFPVDQPFVLAGGQEGTITGGDDLRLKFTQVLEDSRCPTRVACFWTGQARITVVAQAEGDEPSPVEFNTNPAPGLTVQTARVGGYTITLDALDPYPQTPEDSFTLEDYRATLTVRTT